MFSSNGVVMIRYQSVRNLTSPEELANGAKSYFANVPINEILKLDTQHNLRSYIPEHSERKRTQAHKSIQYTLQNNSDRFIQLSRGITVSATSISIDDKMKSLRVINGSIIDGAQTKGEIEKYMNYLKDEGDVSPTFHVRVEFVVDPENDAIVETAIARNTSTDVKKISIAGKKNMFDDLDESFQKTFPDLKLSKSETDVGDEFVDTLKILQVLWVLTPAELMLNYGQMKKKSSTTWEGNKLKAYNSRAYCLTAFESDFINKSNDNQQAKNRYKYYINMVGTAYEEYLKWRHHEGWDGKRMYERTKAIKRDKSGQIPSITVSDGIIFPILSAVSYFVEQLKKPRGSWKLNVPKNFKESAMITSALAILSGNKSKPNAMGSSGDAYRELSQVPSALTGRGVYSEPE